MKKRLSLSLSLIAVAAISSSQSWVKTTDQLVDESVTYDTWTLSGPAYSNVPVTLVRWSKCDGAVSTSPPWTSFYDTIFYTPWNYNTTINVGPTGTYLMDVKISDARNDRNGLEGWTYGSEEELVRSLSWYLEELASIWI